MENERKRKIIEQNARKWNETHEKWNYMSSSKLNSLKDHTNFLYRLIYLYTILEIAPAYSITFNFSFHNRYIKGFEFCCKILNFNH